MSAGVVEIVVVVHAGVTCAMAGAISIVQFVHYPLFAAVGEDRFVEYEASHARRITFVVAPLMLIELATALLLLLVRPAPVSTALLWTGLVLVLVIWISTAAIQVPLHNTLVKGFDAAVHRRLLVSNSLRTVCWLARSVIACIIVVQYFGR